jgi:hypothetical protein
MAKMDVPRGLDFLLDRNRFNVAVSRAECPAVVVVNPRLLDADCRTPAGTCRFVEMAAPVNQPEDVLLGQLTLCLLAARANALPRLLAALCQRDPPG